VQPFTVALHNVHRRWEYFDGLATEQLLGCWATAFNWQWPEPGDSRYMTRSRHLINLNVLPPERHQRYMDAAGKYINCDLLFEFRSRIGTLIFLGTVLAIQPQMRLAAGRSTVMPRPLDEFMRALARHTNSVSNRNRRFSLDNVAEALDHLGVASADGREVQPIHVGNCLNRNIRHTVANYEKQNYKGRNHHYFGSTPSPLKTGFMNEDKENEEA
jgi:hypothetical protein